MSPFKRGSRAFRANRFSWPEKSPNKLVSGLLGQIAFIGRKSPRGVLGWRVKKPRQAQNVTGYLAKASKTDPPPGMSPNKRVLGLLG